MFADSSTNINGRNFQAGFDFGKKRENRVNKTFELRKQERKDRLRKKRRTLSHSKSQTNGQKNSIDDICTNININNKSSKDYNDQSILGCVLMDSADMSIGFESTTTRIDLNYGNGNGNGNGNGMKNNIGKNKNRMNIGDRKQEMKRCIDRSVGQARSRKFDECLHGIQTLCAVLTSGDGKDVSLLVARHGGIGARIIACLNPVKYENNKNKNNNNNNNNTNNNKNSNKNENNTNNRNFCDMTQQEQQKQEQEQIQMQIEMPMRSKISREEMRENARAGSVRAGSVRAGSLRTGVGMGMKIAMGGGGAGGGQGSRNIVSNLFDDDMNKIDKDKIEDLQFRCAWILTNILADDSDETEKYRLEIIEGTNVIDKLGNCLLNTNNEELISQCLWTFANIGAENYKYRAKIISIGFIGYLVQRWLYFKCPAKQETMWCMVQLTNREKKEGDKNTNSDSENEDDDDDDEDEDEKKKSAINREKALWVQQRGVLKLISVTFDEYLCCYGGDNNSNENKENKKSNDNQNENQNENHNFNDDVSNEEKTRQCKVIISDTGNGGGIEIDDGDDDDDEQDEEDSIYERTLNGLTSLHHITDSEIAYSSIALGELILTDVMTFGCHVDEVEKICLENSLINKVIEILDCELKEFETNRQKYKNNFNQRVQRLKNETILSTNSGMGSVFNNININVNTNGNVNIEEIENKMTYEDREQLEYEINRQATQAVDLDMCDECLKILSNFFASGDDKHTEWVLNGKFFKNVGYFFQMINCNSIQKNLLYMLSNIAAGTQKHCGKILENRLFEFIILQMTQPARSGNYINNDNDNEKKNNKRSRHNRDCRIRLLYELGWLISNLLENGSIEQKLQVIKCGVSRILRELLDSSRESDIELSINTLQCMITVTNNFGINFVDFASDKNTKNGVMDNGLSREMNERIVNGLRDYCNEIEEIGCIDQLNKILANVDDWSEDLLSQVGDFVDRYCEAEGEIQRIVNGDGYTIGGIVDNYEKFNAKMLEPQQNPQTQQFEFGTNLKSCQFKLDSNTNANTNSNLNSDCDSNIKNHDSQDSVMHENKWNF